jgi:capsular exopolysaccharide synthesis family protein
MSRIERSIEKASRLRAGSTPVIRNESLPTDDISRFYYEEEEKQAHLRDYLEVLIRRKWIVIAFLLSVVTTGTIATFLMKPLYRASTTMQLKGVKSNILTFQDAYKEGLASETQYNILKSTNLAERVVTKLTLDTINEGDRKSISVGAIKEGLEIQPIKKSQLVNINFVSRDPVFAANVANTVADEYINFARESKLEPAQLGGLRLKKEVEDMRARLEDSEKQLNEYIANSKFLINKQDRNYENLLTTKLSSLAIEQEKATSERISKEAIYQEVNKSGIDYNIVLQNGLIQSLTKDYIKLESQYFELLKIHKPEYPKMLRLKNQIEQLQNRIKVEEQKIINTLHSDYNLALKKEKLLSSAIEKIRQDVNAFQQNMIQFQILKGEVETNTEIYNTLRKRLKEVDISAALTESDAQILDVAQVPNAPFKPKKAQNIVLSLLFGLMGGVFLAFFVEYFDNTIKTDVDIEKISRLPVLGRVPISKATPKELVNVNSNENAAFDIVAFSEAFRSISTRIQFSSASKPPKQLLVTSPMAQDGKTIISLNIAMSLMSSQKKGIIIDADLRRPDVHTLFNIDNSTGLSSFLSGISEFDGLIKKSPYSRLDAITAGPVPPNPSELLNSSRMRELVDGLSAAYDFIIIDSAPVLGMSDSLVLSTIIEGVIVAVKAGNTSGDALSQTNKALKSVNAKILGVVLNGVDINTKYAYSSYYGSPHLNGNRKGEKLL